MKKIISVFMLALILVSSFSGCSDIIDWMEYPEITESKFNFSVTYELNGEQKTISGVYACKFEGVSVSFGATRIWEGEIENSNIEDENRYEIASNKDIVVYLDLGLIPEYFMSDPAYVPEGNVDSNGVPMPSLFVVNVDISQPMLSYDAEQQLLADYGAKIISYEYDKPIENVYRKKGE